MAKLLGLRQTISRATQIVGSFVRRPTPVKICMRIRPRFRARRWSLVFDRPRRFIPSFLLVGPIRLASSHPLVDRSSAPAGKFSSALFINTVSADHLSRIARGFSSFLSMNNRLVELLRGRLSRLREVDHHRLSCLRVWLHAKSTGCPGNFGNTISRKMRNHIHICITF